jgi:glutaredoxin
MTVSDENILLASSPIPGFVSLEYYVYAVLLGIQNDNSYSLPVLRAQLQADLGRMKGQFREEALNKIPLQNATIWEESNRGGELRALFRRRFVQDNILDSYVNRFDIALPDDYKGLERANLAEFIYKSHLKGKFEGTDAEDLVAIIEGQIPTVDGKTVAGYVESRCEETTKQMVGRLVDYTLEHRKQCIMKSPGFKFVLAGVDLDDYRTNAGVNAGDEEDVVENVNFAVLKRLKDEFASELSDSIDLDDAMALISVLQELVLLTCKQEVNGEYLELTPANSKLILDEIFPICDKIAYNNSYIPDGIFDYFYDHPNYTKPEQVTPETDFLPHFWLIYLKYHTVVGFDDDYMYLKSNDFDAQLKLTIIAVNTAKSLAREIPREYTYEQSMKLMLLRADEIVMYSLRSCDLCQKAKKIIGDSQLKRVTVVEVNDVSEIPDDDRKKQTVPFFVVTMPKSGRDESANTFNVNTYTDFEKIMNSQIRPILRK